MAGFNFADRYRAAGLTPGPEILGLRQQPFEKLRKAIDAKTVVELSRLYFGLPSANATDWFRDAFQESDQSFSMVDNQRETALLAGCLLEASFEDGESTSALAPLATAAAGLRQPAASPEILLELAQRLVAKAVSARQRDSTDPKVIKRPAMSKLPDAAAIAQAIPNDWGKIGAFIRQVSDETFIAEKNLADQTIAVVGSMHAELADLREEVSMLWWHIGGWSRLLDMPFSGLSPATAAVLAGLDMSDLSRTLLGPAAAPAILQRTISAGRKSNLRKVTIRDAVDGMPTGALDKLVFGAALPTLPDICPVLTAFAKAREIGGGSEWHASFRKFSGISEEAGFQPLDLATQVFRERMVLYALDGA
jgi:hypothetical protein